METAPLAWWINCRALTVAFAKASDFLLETNEVSREISKMQVRLGYLSCYKWTMPITIRINLSLFGRIVD
jgi:hypothetical protein